MQDIIPIRISDMTLQQHLRNAGGCTEVPVNLEGWMRVKKIWIQPATRRGNALCLHRLEQVLQNDKRVVAIEEARPEVDFPTHAPAGGFVAAIKQRLPRGVEKVCALPGDVLAGID